MEKSREEIIEEMSELLENLKDIKNNEDPKIDTISYFREFEFRGSRLGEQNVYVVKIENKSIEKEGKQQKGNLQEEKEEYYTYELYIDDGKLIATVGKNGKVQFMPEYIELLQEKYGVLYDDLNLSDLDFEMPEEIKDKDIIMTEAELEEASRQGVKNNKAEEKEQNRKEDKKLQNNKENEEEQNDVNSENEEERKEKVAEALGIRKEDVKSLSQINPNEKITDEYNMRDLIPETQNYDRIEIACSKGDDKQGDSRFTILGIKKDGTREPLQSVESIEGVSTNKKTISINDDGSKVEEQSVKGLFRINARNREYGIALNVTELGYMDVMLVSNITDKEHRRATPIKTDSGNRHYPTHEVRENAGDNKEEVKQESETYRYNKEIKGVDPQSLDGIEKGNINNLENIKDQIVNDAIDQGDMTYSELNELVENKLEEQGLELTDSEKEEFTDSITERIADESRFPVKGERK